MQTAREPIVGSSPYPYDFAWRQVHELDGGAGLVVTIVAGAMLCMATLVLWLVSVPFNPVRVDYQTLLVATALVLFFHELAHAVAFSCGRARGLRIECAWQKYRPHLRYQGAVSRTHYLAVLAAPIVAVSLMPIACRCCCRCISGDVVLVSLLNALVRAATRGGRARVPAGAGARVRAAPGRARDLEAGRFLTQRSLRLIDAIATCDWTPSHSRHNLRPWRQPQP
jgi:hypothetical protein